MKELNIGKMIKDTISNKRALVVDVLKKSDIKFNSDLEGMRLSNQQVLDIINSEVKKGNTKLVQNFGLLINQIYDMQPIIEDLKSENFASFNAENKKSIVMVDVNNNKKILNLK